MNHEQSEEPCEAILGCLQRRERRVDDESGGGDDDVLLVPTQISNPVTTCVSKS